MDKQAPVNRLNYAGNLTPVIERLCENYRIGELTSFSVIEIGYEDCNVSINTASGKYLAKIFSKVRTPEDISRYAAIMEKVVAAGVHHPEIIKVSNGDVLYIDHEANGISLVLMRFIEGKTFLQLKSAPNDKERQAVIEQAAKVNTIEHHPSYLFDSWAIPNIQAMFERVRKFIQPDDLVLVEKAMKLFAEVPLDALPHCFVHGDFTKANVLRGNDGRIYILDFSVANWYPRIQELAVIAANLLHDGRTSLKDRTDIVADEYDKLSRLTPEEQNYLYPYALAGAAMEFMGSHQEKYINGNDTEETQFWLNLGREGLAREVS